ASVALRFARQGGIGPVSSQRAVAVESQQSSARGGTVVRLQRTIDGVPLIGGDLAVDVTRDGRVRAASGKDTWDRTVDTTPRVTAEDAAAAALQSTARDQAVDAAMLTAGDPGLRVFDPRLFEAPGIPRAQLVWQVEVTSPARPDVRQLVLVDAHRGHILLSLDNIQQALDRSTCDAAMTSGRIPCELPLDVAAGERGESDPESAIEDVNLAHEYAGDSYDFFYRLFGRDSIDDAGMPLLSTVRYREDPATNYKNAFWNGEQMTYGEGMVAQDVVAHELAHGVTEHRSPLFYYFQSGAINESLSDIFGEFVDLEYPGGNDDPEVRWQMGEDIVLIFGFTLRSMKDPTLSQHPDRTGSIFFRALDEDRGGVHRNSGVGNKFAYLLTDGDTFNGQTVRGIGIEKTARIVYGAMPMLTSAADYQMLAKAVRSSCAALRGTFGITADDCSQADRALVATEMDIEPVNGRVAAAPVCGTSPSDPASAAVPVRLWSDGFEDDTLAWLKSVETPDSPQAPYALWYRSGDIHESGYALEAFATEGTHNLWGDNPDFRYDASIAMAEPVAIPQGQVFLRFAHSFQFHREAGGLWDGGVLEYRVAGEAQWRDAGPLLSDNGYTGTLSGYGSDNPLKGREAFAGVSRGYITTRADLSSLAGKSVSFRFRVATNSSVGSEGWYVDDVSVYACPRTPRIRGIEPGRTTLGVRATVPEFVAAPVTRVDYRINGGSWRSSGRATGRFTISGLRPGRPYTVEVRTVHGAGRSASSPPVTVMTKR
ncbi:MAG: M4 family metallopeptidase, partial [bacterium]